MYEIGRRIYTSLIACFQIPLVDTNSDVIYIIIT